MLNLIGRYYRFCQSAHNFEASKNYYKILEVQPKSSKAFIRNSYLQLVKKYHPDLNPRGKEHFNLIQEAYKVLSDPEARRQYDQFSRGTSSSQQQHPGSRGSAYTQARDSQNFKGQSTHRSYHKQQASQYQSGQTVRNPWEELQRSRKKWKQEFEQSNPHTHRYQQQKPRPAADPIDEEYRKLQHNFSLNNPLNKSPHSDYKMEPEPDIGLGEYWQSLKNKLWK